MQKLKATEMDVDGLKKKVGHYKAKVVANDKLRGEFNARMAESQAMLQKL